MNHPYPSFGTLTKMSCYNGRVLSALFCQAYIKGDINGYMDIHTYCKMLRFQSVVELPYFEGDHMNTILESCIQVSFQVGALMKLIRPRCPRKTK